MVQTPIAKSTQEQALAAWISFRNVLRLQDLASHLAKQDINLETAMAELLKLKLFVSDPQHILGSILTKHGEIAEHVQVNFSNAERMVTGQEPNHVIDTIGRTAAEDYLRDGRMVQSKFYFGTSGSLHAIANHLDTYPDFVEQGGVYDIPKNQYQELVGIYNAGEAGNTLSSSDSKLYEAIKEWETAHNLKVFEVVHPSVVDYQDVQLDTVHQTISIEEAKIESADQEIRKQAYDEIRPTLQEGLKVTAIAAALEGGMTFITRVYNKIHGGKKLSDFDADDWKNVGINTGIGTLKGGIRGGSVYLLTNFADMPAPVASALVTATFGMLALAYRLRDRKITSEEFVDASQALCFDVTVSALSSIFGEILIPIPVLGTIIGNTAGMFMLNIARAYLDESEQKLISAYQEELHHMTEELDSEHQKFVETLNQRLSEYESLAMLAFSIDVNIRFKSSMDRAKMMGVSRNRILTREQGEALFTTSDSVTL